MSIEPHDASAGAIDAVEIDRLVSGRLPADEQVALLQWADAYPENWRPIAAAFLLEQSLRQRPHVVPRPGLPQRLRRSRVVEAAAALCLVAAVAATAGSAYGRRQAIAQLPPPAKPKAYVVVAESDDRASEAEKALADIREGLARLSRPLLDDAARASLLEAGLVAEESPHITLVNGPDGRQYALPRRQLRFRPVAYTDVTPVTPRSPSTP